MIQLRTYTYIDILQPQVAAFQATISQGFLPVEGQASLFIEIAPGIMINQLTDAVLKRTRVKPGMQIVEREFGILEVHDFDQAQVRSAGEVILEQIEQTEADRLKPQIVSSQILTGIDPHHSMLINRMRHGDMIRAGETMFVFETYPAGYVLLAANEAEKAAEIKVLEIRAFGAFGRLHLAGNEAEIQEAAKAMTYALEKIDGRTEAKAGKA
jgi:hypothetical protein